MVRSSTSPKEREFKDPDVSQSDWKRAFAFRILLAGIASIGAVIVILYLAYSFIPSSVGYNSTSVSKTPDYISVNYNDNVFEVRYNNSAASDIVVGIDTIQNSYTLPLRVYTSRYTSPFSANITDRDWGVMYLVSVEETVKNESFTYYWMVSKTAIGYTSVKNL